jgi:hypothetical protein
MKNQLFKKSPDVDTTIKLLNHFGIQDLNDNHSFHKKNLIDLDTVSEISNMVDELEKYYLPCKAKVYLSDINERKCITILRQFLKSQGYTLISKEKYINKKKLLIYQVIPLQIDIKTDNRDTSKIILSFD